MTEQPSPDYLAAFRSLRDTAARVLGGSSHEHDWAIVDTWRPQTTIATHPRMQQSVPHTYVLIICTSCHLPQTVELEGTWTTEQVTARAAEQPAQDDQ